MNRQITAAVAGRIESFLGEFGAPKGIFPVDIVIRGQRGNLVVEVFIDGDAAVDAGTCAEVSRALGVELDGGALAGEPYTLTVSSPGLDRPLRFPRQYAKHVGRSMSLHCRSEAGDERLRGVLASAGDASIRISPEGGAGEREIAYGDIVRATVEPRW